MNFLKEPKSKIKKKKKNFFVCVWGEGRGGGTRVSEFCLQRI